MKWYIIIIIGIAVAVSSYVYGYGQGKDKEHIAGIKAVAEQKKASEKECQKSQQKTTEVDNELQTNLSAINGKLSYNLMLTPACVMPAPSDTPSNNATSGGKSTGHNGLSTFWLHQYAAEAETYRVKLMACQQLLIKERE